MDDKKSATRFTIQFNRTDHAHLRAADILNQYERFGKARHIVNAILHYEDCEHRDMQPSAKIDEKYIETVVNRILRENCTSGDDVRLDSDDVKREHNQKPLDEIDFDGAMEMLGEDGLNAVADALDMFRKK
ncbi:MAG: hypothetical protein FWF15_00165 [Oscillospiraceae bacterium]|nr:hypothetical protein [Oscillospiraceae bacterium]